MAPKVITRRGDAGYTDMADGTRVQKWDPRICSLGDLQETDTAIAVARAESAHEEIRDRLYDLQTQLYQLMAELSGSATFAVTKADVDQLEAWSNGITTKVPLPRKFLRPGPTKGAAYLEHASSVSRRAERGLSQLMHHGVLKNPHIMLWTNRVSDYLWLLARLDAHLSGVDEETLHP